MNELAATDIQVLHEALDDEYHSYTTYDQVIVDFGEVRPFINIREAEGRHIAALFRLFEKYDQPIPANPWPGKVERYKSLKEACEGGVAAEIANSEMYERLLGMTQRDDIAEVLGNLQAASQSRHLPAFQRCVERQGSSEGGMGRKRRRERGHSNRIKAY
jgi:hypothetical protein